jgi:hypothetical protein
MVQANNQRPLWWRIGRRPRAQPIQLCTELVRPSVRPPTWMYCGRMLATHSLTYPFTMKCMRSTGYLQLYEASE